MRTIDYYKIYKYSILEIKNELTSMIQEIKEYLLTHDDLSPSFIKMMNDDIFDLENNLNVVFNFKEMNIDIIKFEYLDNLINVSKKLNLNINFYVKKR